MQVSEGDEIPVKAMYKTSSNISHAVGTVIAKSGCWSMLKGGISVNNSGPAELYFEVLLLLLLLLLIHHPVNLSLISHLYL